MAGKLIKNGTRFEHIQAENTVSPMSTDIECDGFATAVIQVDDATDITIEVYGTTTGAKWDSLAVISLGDLAHTWYQISGNGLWATGCVGLSAIRLTTTSLTGTANIYVGLSTGAFAWPYCCGDSAGQRGSVRQN